MPVLELLPPIPGLEFQDDGHAYFYDSARFGRVRPDSVSQVMSATGAKTFNPSAWRHSLITRDGMTPAEAEAHCEHVRKTRAYIGTTFHLLAQHQLLYESIHDSGVAGVSDEDTEALAMFGCFMEQFYHRIGKVYIVEQPLIHRGALYVGTPDLLAEVDGRLTLVDWKTHRAGQGRVRPEWLIQQGAYVALIKSCYGVDVHHGGNLLVAADAVKLQPWNSADLRQGQSLFFGFLAEHHARQAALGSELHHAALTAISPMFSLSPSP